MERLVHEERGLRFSLHKIDDLRCQFMVERISDGHTLASRLLRPEALECFEAVVEAWIAERIGVPEPDPVMCTACGSRLVAVGRMDSEHQFDNALWLEFSGGYGMFIDPCGEEPPRAVLCHDCAHQLCDLLPWMAGLLQPSRSHSHRSEVAAALIESGHDGWDLEGTRLDAGPLLDEHLAAEHAVTELPDGARARWALHYRAHHVPAVGHRHPFPNESGGLGDVDVIDGP